MSSSTGTIEVDSTVESSITIESQQQRQQLKSLSLNGMDVDDGKHDDNEDLSMVAILTLQDITETPPTSMEGEDDTNQSTTIPKVRFIDDIAQYIESFTPKLVTAELLVGAYTQLHTKYKLSETSLLRKRTWMLRFSNLVSIALYILSPWSHFAPTVFTILLPVSEEHLKEKVPELEKSLSLVQSLIEKQESKITAGIVRYNLVDSIYAKAEIDYTVGIVYLWLGANVMLEYTYEEAIQFLQTNYTRATTELQRVKIDLSFIRDQIVTTEVNISRIYNWDVRQKRNATTANPTSSGTDKIR